jgi:hypothetical protein
MGECSSCCCLVIVHTDDCRKMQDSLQRGQRQVQQVKIRLGMQIDDKQFQQMVVDSGVSGAFGCGHASTDLAGPTGTRPFEVEL